MATHYRAACNGDNARTPKSGSLICDFDMADRQPSQPRFTSTMLEIDPFGPTGVAVQKFPFTRGRVRRELLNRHTSNSMILVSLLNPKFAIPVAAGCMRTSGSGH